MECRRVWECGFTFWGPCWSKGEQNSKTLHVVSQEKALVFQMMRSWLKVAYRQWSRKPGEQASGFVSFRHIPGIWGCRSISPQVSWFYFFVVWLWSQADCSGQHYRCWQLLGLPGRSLIHIQKQRDDFLSANHWMKVLKLIPLWQHQSCTHRRMPCTGWQTPGRVHPSGLGALSPRGKGT